MYKMTCRDQDDSSSQPAQVNEQSEFEPLKFYCIQMNFSLLFIIQSNTMDPDQTVPTGVV